MGFGSWNPIRDVKEAIDRGADAVRDTADTVAAEVRREGADIVAQTERVGEQLGPAQYGIPIAGQALLARDMLKGKGPVGELYDAVEDTVMPDFPDFPDTMSQFLGAEYDDEEEEDEIQFGGTGTDTTGSKASTVREKAPTKTVDTGLRVASGGGLSI